MENEQDLATAAEDNVPPPATVTVLCCVLDIGILLLIANCLSMKVLVLPVSARATA